MKEKIYKIMSLIMDKRRNELLDELKTDQKLLVSAVELKLFMSKPETDLINWDPKYLNQLLLDSSKNEDIELMSICLNLGADPNYGDEVGNRVLHYALKSGNRQIMTMLLSYDVDEHLKNNNGQSAVDLAIDSKTAEWFIQSSRKIRLHQLFAAQKDIISLKQDVAELRKQIGFFKETTPIKRIAPHVLQDHLKEEPANSESMTHKFQSKL